TWPYAVLGVVIALNALALGLIGARGVRAISAADDASARMIMSRQFSRSIPYELLGFAASLAAVVPVVVGRPCRTRPRRNPGRGRASVVGRRLVPTAAPSAGCYLADFSEVRRHRVQTSAFTWVPFSRIVNGWRLGW